MTSYAIDADWTADAPVITVGFVELPASCQVTHTAGANEVAQVRYQASVQFDQPDILLMAPVVDNGSGPAFAVGFYELAGTGAADIAAVSTSARIPLTQGVTYTFYPGIGAGHLAGVDLNVFLGTCHGSVTIVTEGPGSPVAAPVRNESLVNPITGAITTPK